MPYETDDPRYIAHYAVYKAIKDKRLIRPDVCEKCNKKEKSLHAHHHNGYDKEHVYDVEWLCLACHAIAHPDRIKSLQDGSRKRWASMSFDERSTFMKEFAANLTEEQKARQQQSMKDAWAQLTPKERTRRTASQVEAARIKFNKERRSQAMKDMWARLTPEERRSRVRGTRRDQ